MAFQINFNGILVSTNTADEAATLLKKLAGPNGGQMPATSAPVSAPSLKVRRILTDKQPVGLPENFDAAKARTAALLSAIQQAGGSIDSDEVQQIVGADHARGIGAKLRPVKRVLEELGYQPEDIYVWERSEDGPVWLAKPKLEEALQKLTK